ncbi:hypothetical protein [Paenibacillus alvei]|uniref:Uncharacterized protein n=1 Tax=Paenibacillus alvei TaxID=44250 RepID=A0A383R9N7_PAEAL|nr:hypothetical protein [Paenibacillus alvei]SYX83046.1 conserved protein of unknown function [Paenibacillus alvei]
MMCENRQFPNSIFNIDRKYTAHLMKAIEAAQAKADELGLDLSNCSIDCREERLAEQSDSRIFSFWFYSEDLVDWMEGFSENFYDFSVAINPDTGQVIQILGPSRRSAYMKDNS